MVITNFPTRGGGKISKQQVVDALGYTPAGGQGVNLLTGTMDFSGEWGSLNAWTIENEKYNGLTVISSRNWYTGVNEKISVKAGEIYTFSAFVKADSDIEMIARASMYSGSPENEVLNPPLKGFYVSSEFKRYSFVFRVLKDATVGFKMENAKNNNIKHYVCGYKLEPGTVTDPVWTPAPEDVVVQSELDAELDYSISRFGKNTLKNVNLNNITKSGLYALSGNITSNPGWNWGGLAVFDGRQFSWDTTGISVSTRYFYNGNWSEWTRLTP